MTTLHVHGKAYACSCILFDKDGTLLDFMRLWGHWAEQVTHQMYTRVTSLGGQLPHRGRDILGLYYDELNQLIGYDKKGPLAMASVQETEGLLAWQLYAAGMPWNEAISEIREICASASAEIEYKKQADPMPDLIPFLNNCRAHGIPMGVVSTDLTKHAVRHLDGLTYYFNTIVGNDRVKQGKPAADSVILACNELGTRLSDAVIIGDSNADMQMGKAANVGLTIGYCPDRKDEVLLKDAEICIRSYADLEVRE
ncbi:phosphoglycolate phosphatase [Paenibacillus shirakamiensis]|uniref:Phosphoglycolate phosphatase n=1 Tax=Paenibacillus shirakamiensis TaxID=1265935 RepID=A0ABS4JBF7_9BACL|nr:HAD family phosphatase [Paenibacillus shirakamiensis]MBP1999043.1 phosphoglycolate phosphatase [Paenibacillus shirakamiensis]